jgi:hypothetical protein
MSKHNVPTSGREYMLGDIRVTKERKISPRNQGIHLVTKSNWYEHPEIVVLMRVNMNQC